MSTNIFLQKFKVKKNHREKLHNHRSLLIWFTGLSGSGKSTLADLLEYELHQMKISTFILDGDNVRNGINKDLTFSEIDRSENIRRIAEIAKLFIDAGVVTIASFISPNSKSRNYVKKIVGTKNFIEIYINSSLSECEKRDVKGLYKKARSGKIKNMTGINAPYEAPKSPDLVVKTDELSIEESLQLIKEFVIKRMK